MWVSVELATCFAGQDVAFSTYGCMNWQRIDS